MTEREGFLIARVEALLSDLEHEEVLTVEEVKRALQRILEEQLVYVREK